MPQDLMLCHATVYLSFFRQPKQQQQIILHSVTPIALLYRVCLGNAPYAGPGRAPVCADPVGGHVREADLLPGARALS